MTNQLTFYDLEVWKTFVNPGEALEVRFIKWLLTIGSAVIVFILGITGYELNNIRTGIQDIHTEIADVKKDIADIESSISILVPHPDRNGVHETI